MQRNEVSVHWCLSASRSDQGCEVQKTLMEVLTFGCPSVLSFHARISRQRLNYTDLLVLDNATLCDGDADRVSAMRTPCPHEGVACPMALLPCPASMHSVAVLKRGPPGWYAICMLEPSNRSWKGPHHPDAASGRRQQHGERAGMRTRS